MYRKSWKHIHDKNAWHDAKKTIPPRCPDEPERFTVAVIIYCDVTKCMATGYYSIDDCASDIHDDKQILKHGWGQWFSDADDLVEHPTHWCFLPEEPKDFS